MAGVLQRVDFNSIKAKYKRLGKGKVRLTESSLILKQAIQPNKTAYNFPVLDTNAGNAVSVLPEEIRLNINDEFIITKCGIYLGGKYFNENLPQPDGVPVWFSAVPYELGGSGWVLLQRLYNGNLSIAVNNINYIDKWDVKKHEFRGITQFQNTSVGQPFATSPNMRFLEDGMVPMTPNVTLSGAKKNDINIVLPDTLILPPAVAWLTPNGIITVNVDTVIVAFRGFLAQNASNFQGAVRKAAARK